MSLIRDKIKQALRSERGALAPAFAIILPCLLAMMSFGLDSANLLLAKTRLANAMDEAALAVSASGKSNLNESELREAQRMAASYIRYHLPGITDTPTIHVSGSNEHTDANGFKFTRYELSAGVKVPIIFDLGALGGFGHEVNTGSGHRLVKKFTSVATDYVFVLDFSGSMKGTRLNDLKSVVKEISEFAINNNKDTKIALVPFSNGVPVKLPGKNERGGERVGCSVLFVPKANYNIDYAFWADKYMNKNNKNYNDYYNKIMYEMDKSRYNYYIDYVGGSLPKMASYQVKDQWCKRNDKNGPKEGRYEYTCKTDGYPDSDIFSSAAKLKISREYNAFLNIYSTLGGAIVDDKSIDYEATMKKMFDKTAIITFPLPWTLLNRNYRPFSLMCQNGGRYGSTDGNTDLSHSTARSWLIGLTGDLSVLNQFQNMREQGGTQISSGLIRSVPVMMEGRNKRKVFILISDGDDNQGSGMTENFLKKYHLCDRIKEGIVAREETHTARVDMFYISVTSSSSRVNFWADYCVGEGKAKTSTTRQALLNEIKGIMTDETGHFAN